jgi:proliferating cell nuclear antigen
MFKATLQDVSMLKDSLDAISSLITEATFKIEKNGMNLIAMDPASVAMVIFKILPSVFLEYECPQDSEMTINLPNFVSILKRARANDKITLELSENKLNIKMVGDFKRSFSLPLIDVPHGSQKVPELSFKAKVEFIAGVLKDGIKDASMVSDCVMFEAKENSFVIKSFGDLSETKLELTKESPSLISLEVSGEQKAKYSIDYLDKIMKGIKPTDKIILSFSTDYPMRLDCNKVDKYQLSYILAPRVDTE